jgi:hypothetical protein
MNIGLARRFFDRDILEHYSVYIETEGGQAKHVPVLQFSLRGDYFTGIYTANITIAPTQSSDAAAEYTITQGYNQVKTGEITNYGLIKKNARVFIASPSDADYRVRVPSNCELINVSSQSTYSLDECTIIAELFVTNIVWHKSATELNIEVVAKSSLYILQDTQVNPDYLPTTKGADTFSNLVKDVMEHHGLDKAFTVGISDADYQSVILIDDDIQIKTATVGPPQKNEIHLYSYTQADTQYTVTASPAKFSAGTAGKKQIKFLKPQGNENILAYLERIANRMNKHIFNIGRHVLIASPNSKRLISGVGRIIVNEDITDKEGVNTTGVISITETINYDNQVDFVTIRSASGPRGAKTKPRIYRNPISSAAEPPKAYVGEVMNLFVNGYEQDLKYLLAKTSTTIGKSYYPKVRTITMERKMTEDMVNDRAIREIGKYMRETISMTYNSLTYEGDCLGTIVGLSSDKVVVKYLVTEYNLEVSQGNGAHQVCKCVPAVCVMFGSDEYEGEGGSDSVKFKSGTPDWMKGVITWGKPVVDWGENVVGSKKAEK